MLFGSWYVVRRSDQGHWPSETNSNEKKTLREMQTLCTGCSKAEPKFFDPPQTPFPQRAPNLISWRWSLPLPTNPAW